jgi:hypothetical protein
MLWSILIETTKVFDKCTMHTPCNKKVERYKMPRLHLTSIDDTTLHFITAKMHVDFYLRRANNYQ